MSLKRKTRTDRVAEPVQVYLEPPDQDRLERLTEHLATTKSDVLRRGLEALELEVTDPARHPALRVIGLGASAPIDGDGDPARDHDFHLTDSEQASWSAAEDGRGG